MARTEARVLTSTWRDAEFVALPPNAKLLYLTLMTHPELSAGGTMPLLLHRLARYTGLDAPAVERAIDELGEDGWVFVDDLAQEIFVSGYFAAEKIGRQPRRVISALEDIRRLDSQRLAAIASAELAELANVAVPPVPRGLRAEVLERDGHQCKCCGWQPGDPVPVNSSGREIYRALEIDHVHPRSKGGEDSAANFQVLCTTCNTRKGAKT
ncbi:MAG: HNH endonuclease [Streptosporangiaceae bacterium]|jgi:hypothetical protein